ncbi:hypothetical protein E2C01_025479 [Portunus trituberculatus]|uniref:Uncharacterized protein n=1 Tax=Portunus trituberculatus TaxID=210409 RepID=A0A5B7EGJ6_PORTR|nr:hypothetical protein [Portunus trituberculatus]
MSNKTLAESHTPYVIRFSHQQCFSASAIYPIARLAVRIYKRRGIGEVGEVKAAGHVMRWAARYKREMESKREILE